MSFHKRWFFFGWILFYVGGGILGLLGNAYTEVQSLDRTINGNLFYLIAISILIGSTSFYFFKSIFAKDLKKQGRFSRMLVAVIFMVVSFGLIRGWVQTINTIGQKQRIFVDGHIFSKTIESSGKARFYYLDIIDKSQRHYRFIVKKTVFKSVGNNGKRIYKQFLVGSLGILYRPEP